MSVFSPYRFFRKQRAERLVKVPVGVPHLDFNTGVNKYSWEAQHIPDVVGTGNYAFEGMCLPFTDILGTGQPYKPYAVTQPAKMVNPGVVANGIGGNGVGQGTFYGQPLVSAKGTSG